MINYGHLTPGAITGKIALQSSTRGHLPRIAATLNKVLKSDARGVIPAGVVVWGRLFHRS